MGKNCKPDGILDVIGNTIKRTKVSIYFDAFVNDRENYLRFILSELNLAYEETIISFRDTFGKYGCRCGNDYGVGKSDILVGSHFFTHKIKRHKLEEHFKCMKCGCVHGMGGFNPYNEIDVNRINRWQTYFNQHDKDIITDRIAHKLGYNFVDFFNSSDYLTYEKANQFIKEYING